MTLLVIALTLAVPVALLAWLLFGRLYAEGQLEPGLDRKSFRASMKRIRCPVRWGYREPGCQCGGLPGA